MAFKLRKHKRKYHRHAGIGVKLKKQTVYTVAAVWFWLFAGVITLSFLGEGSALRSLRGSLLLYVGWVYYVLPVFLVSLSTLFFKVKSGLGSQNVPMGFGIALFGLMACFNSGIIGEIVWGYTAEAITPAGSYMLYLFVFLVGLIIAFNASLDRFINATLIFLQNGFEKILSWMERKKKPEFAVDVRREPMKIRGSDEDKPLLKQPVTPPPAQDKTDSGKVSAGAIAPKLTQVTPSSQDMKLWEYPPLSLLADGPKEKADRGDVKEKAAIIEKTLDSFGVQSHVVEVNQGPAVTQYALSLASGTKVSKITSLSNDLALSLAAPTGQVRIEAPIPGKNLVGIEVPNRGLEFVTLKKMFVESDNLIKHKSKLAVTMGKDVAGNPFVSDIAKMPHVLVAGTTGSGKSVLLNAWICSLLYRTTPAEVRMILVDPKRVELVGYNGIPHLLTPVIVDADKILSALRWAVGEMERRYKQFAEVGVRNVDGFNELSGFQALPYIVIVIDELADLMAYAPVEVEDTICRIAQMARATGIHLVIATQRPSVNVITGLIKANIPTRVAFNVASMIDSRVIIDMPGAEKLLGRGDMLYVPPDQAKPMRIQGTFVSDKEVQRIVEFFRNKQSDVQYSEEIISQPVGAMKKGSGGGTTGGDGRDEKFEEALRLVCQHDKASSSLLQRRLQLGYARAARIMDQLEDAGIIGPAEGAKPRDVLIKNPDEYLAQQQGEQNSQ